MHAISIDIGGTAIKYGLIDEQGRIHWESTSPTPLTSQEAVLDEIMACVQRVKLANPGLIPVCIGIGTPGLVDITRGYVMGGAGQLPEWENLPLATIIADATGLPVYVDNDANMMALGEYIFGGTPRVAYALFFTIGTGIGGAIIIEGELYRGSKNAGAELGCFPWHWEGRWGYWEDFASMKSLTERYNKLCDAGSEIVATAKTIFDKAERGERLARQLLDENAELIGRGIAGYINIFNPDAIIIGGGISDSQPGFIERIKTTAFDHALEDCRRGVNIFAASLGNKAGFIGAGYYALSRFTQQP